MSAKRAYVKRDADYWGKEAIKSRHVPKPFKAAKKSDRNHNHWSKDPRKKAIAIAKMRQARAANLAEEHDLQPHELGRIVEAEVITRAAAMPVRFAAMHANGVSQVEAMVPVAVMHEALRNQAQRIMELELRLRVYESMFGPINNKGAAR
jgi:hypothetical protein